MYCPFNNLEYATISTTDPDYIYCFSIDTVNEQEIVYKTIVGGGNSESSWETILFGDAIYDVSNAIVDFENPHCLWIACGEPNDLFYFNTKTKELRSASYDKASNPFENNWDARIIQSLEQEVNSNKGIYVLCNSAGWQGNVITDNIYYTDETLDEWIGVKDGLPNIKVSGIKVNNVVGEIYAGTYGRGMWKSNLYCSAVDGNYNLPLNFMDESVHYSNNITGFYAVGGDITLRAGNEIVFNPGFSTNDGTDMVAVVKPCSESISNLKTPGSEVNFSNEDDTEERIKDTDLIESFAIYPNPNNGSFLISAPSSNLKYSFSIFNAQGKKIFGRDNVFGTFDVNDLQVSKGVLFVHIVCGSDVFIKKVVVGN